jgi:uncharacterized protein (UPF0264 family)
VTRLLVSVRSAAEARSALAGGADLIDIKEPSLGSLGAATPQVWAEIANEVGERRPLSAALGELRDFQPFDPASLSGYRFTKLGLAGCDLLEGWPKRWQVALASLPGEITRVAVAYADARAAQSPAPDTVCEVGQRLGCRALLIDTFNKSGGSVFDVLSFSELETLLAGARRSGMMTVLAGSLRLEQLPRALALQPDYVAVRGAVCGRSRECDLEERLVRHWSQAMRLSASVAAEVERNTEREATAGS